METLYKVPTLTVAFLTAGALEPEEAALELEEASEELEDWALELASLEETAPEESELGLGSAELEEAGAQTRQTSKTLDKSREFE